MIFTIDDFFKKKKLKVTKSGLIDPGNESSFNSTVAQSGSFVRFHHHRKHKSKLNSNFFGNQSCFHIYLVSSKMKKKVYLSDSAI